MGEFLEDIVQIANKFRQQDIRCVKDYFTIEKELQKDYTTQMKQYNTGKGGTQPQVPTHKDVMKLLDLHYKGCEVIGDYE